MDGLMARTESKEGSFFNSLFSIRGHVLCELQTSQQLYETLAESATSHNNHGGR